MTNSPVLTEPKEVVADYPHNFTRVTWDQAIVNEYRVEEWSSSRYRFGPSVRWHTRNASTHQIIAWDEEIPLDAWVDFIIEVPYSALDDVLPHAVGLQGTYYNLSEMKDGDMQHQDMHPISIFAMYFVSESRWEVYSSKMTNWPEGPPGDLPENVTLVDVFGEPVEPFTEMDEANCLYSKRDDLEAYRGRFRLAFNTSTLPGFYAFSAMAFNSDFQTVAESRFSEQSGRLLGLDLHSIVNEAFGGYYTISRLNDDGDILYTANRGEDFNVTVTVSNATIMDNVTIHFSAPSQFKVQKWVYGPYQEEHVRTGAWEWDEASGTYLWNASIVLTWSEPRLGYHWEDTFTWVDLSKEYTFYDPWGPSYETMRTWADYAVSYDFKSSSWMYFAVYHYDNHTFNGEYWEYVQWEEYEPWNPEWPIPFLLNETASSIFYNIKGKLVVNFRGHISENMLPSGHEYGQTLYTWERVMNVLGQQLVNYVYLPLATLEEKIDYENQRQLAIDTPVSIVKLNLKGQLPKPDWMFQVDPGETFVVRSRLQGGAELASEIDGVAFVMHGHQDEWGTENSTDWWQYSDIQIEVKVGPLGGVEINVYNYTVRTSWGYGEYYEWVRVEIADGVYDYERILLEGWFWKEEIWDFEIGNWTNKHFPMKSSQSKMSVSYLSAGNVSYAVVDDDLRIIFDVTLLPDVPSLEWNWDYFYGNLTWVTDYESGWGSHTVLGWTEDTVYHYMNGTDMVYVEKPYKAPIFRNNATGALYEREKIPYVLIDGKPERLKSYIRGEFDYTYETLIREDYDYTLEDYRRYIKLYNGTELEVFGDYIAVVYNITLPMLGGTSFLSFNEFPQYMGFIEGNDYYYMIAANGSVIVGTWWAMWDGHTTTRVDFTPVEKVKYTYVTYATPIDPFEPSKTKPIYMAGWPEYVGPDHWVMYLNGTWEPIDVWKHWEDSWLYYYHNGTDGRLYVFEWPWELMKCNYLGQDLYLPHSATKLFAYVTVGGTDYPIPDVGEPLNGWWEIDWVIRSRYSVEIAYINGTGYIADRLPEMEWTSGPPEAYWYHVYQVSVSSVLYNLTDWGFDPGWGVHVMSYDYYPESLPWVTKANGSLFIPDVWHTDWTVAVGYTNLTSMGFEITAWLDTVGGYYDGDYHSSYISYHNGTHHVVDTKDGEQFVMDHTWRAVFHKITLSNGTYFYSAHEHPNIWPTDIYDPSIDQFYMIDIYGNEQWWYGWDDFTVDVIVVENVTGDAWSGGTFWFEGMSVSVTQFTVTYWEWTGLEWIMREHVEDSVWPNYYDYLQAANGTIYEIIPLHHTPQSYRYNFPSWQFFIDGVFYNITGSSDMIYKAYRFEGYSKKLDYAPLPVSIIRTQGSIVTGSPDFGMWDIELYSIDPATGALDLDGNLDTKDDQYFLKEIHSSKDTYNITQEYLDVTIYWDPDNSTWGDEFFLHSFTGMVKFNWTFEWADYYIWTNAATGEVLTPAQMDAVRDILLDEYNNTRPGYWNVAWLAYNFTHQDLLNQAGEKGWDWAMDNSREWSWLWWELEEYYSTEITNGTHTDLADISLAYQYAGMFAWEDKSNDNFMDIDVASLGSAEMTHYWMPVNVDSVSFVTPGEAWGNDNATGSEYRDVNETIDFGVTFANVTGIVFPFGKFSYWDWYVGQYYGSDFATFNERPTECMTDELSIDVHFTGIVNETGFNIAQVKFDITVGDWDLDTPGGIAVLEGVSLAVSFLSDLTIVIGGNGGSASAAYLDDYGQALSNEIATSSANYTMASGNSSVALMSLGGAPYSWSKNLSYPATVTAQTIPLSAMSSIYLSGSGSTATTFSISTEQFYTLIGFKWWDGWKVAVDPIFVGYISHGDSTAPSISGVSHERLEVGSDDYCHIEAQVEDAGGIDEVKVWDIDNNVNHSMTFNEISGLWEVNVLRAVDGRYEFNYQIVAIDNAGNTAYTTTRTFMFWDNIVPEIQSVSIENGTDGFGREIATVTATVFDEGGSGIDQVTLTYSNATGNYDVTMTLSAGDYVGTIPNHPPTTIISYWVTAIDGDANSVQSSVNQFTFSTGTGGDVYGPSISLIQHEPDEPTPLQAVTVSATILDISSVDRAVLQYRVGTGAWVNATMTQSGDTWSAVIPAQADGSSVTYRIVAYDTLGNQAVSGEFSYVVSDVTTTGTTSETTTTAPDDGEPGDMNILLILGGLGGLVLLVVILAGARRRR